MKINVLYIVSTLKKVGPNKQQLYIFKNLDRNVFNPSILTLSDSDKDSMKKDFSSIKVPVDSLGMNRIVGQFFAKKLIKKYVIKKKIKLVHAFGFRADNFTRNISCPVISTVRNYPYDEYGMFYNALLGQYIASRHIEIILSQKNPILCSKNLAKKFFINHKKKLPAIQNAVDTGYFKVDEKSISNSKAIKIKYKLPADKKVLLCSTRLIKLKNIDLIIKMFTKNKLFEKGLILVISGDGPEKSNLQKLSKGYDSIFFLGFINNIKELYAISDFFISASKSEGLPNAVLEALSCGLPCILSDIPGHKEIFLDNLNLAKFFNNNSISDLHKKILELLDEDYDTLSKSIRNHIKKYFSAESMSKKYEESYKKILLTKFNG